MDREQLSKAWSQTFGVDDLDTLDPETSFDPGRRSGDSRLGTLPLLEVSGDSDALATQPSAGDASEPAAAAPGQVRFALGEVVGRGGMGVVYRAEQTSLFREIAVKRVHPLKTDTKLRAKFLAEARVTGLLDHPNIVPVYDLGLDAGGEPLLAMKLVGGVDWKSLLHPRSAAEKERAAELDLLENVRILIDVSNAVAFAHRKGVLHLDLKPSNVMVGEFGEVLVMDWGLAAAYGDKHPHLPHCSSIRGPCGTPSYLAPELAGGEGHKIGPWTDVYLLGGMLYEVLAGKPPHAGATFLQILMASVRSTPRSYPDGVPAGLQAICEQALAGAPDERFASVLAFRQALQDWLRHHESSEIAERAARGLDGCEARLDELDPRRVCRDETSQSLYADFAAAVVAFQQSRLLWDGNPEARRGEQRARRGYARAALTHGDLVLARAQATALASDDPERGALLAAVEEREAGRRRARRRVSRLRWGIWSVALALLLSLGIGLTLVEGARKTAEQQRQEADLQRSAADHQRADAERSRELAAQREEVARNTLNTLIFSVDRRLRELPGEVGRGLREELLEAAFTGLDNLRAADVAEDSLSLTTAGAHVQLGDLRRIQGRPDEALKHYRAGLHIYQEVLAGADVGAHHDHILVLGKVGLVARQIGDFALAREHFAESLERARAWQAAEPESQRARSVLASSLSQMSWLEAVEGAMSRQEELSRASVDILRELFEQLPQDAEICKNLADQLSALGQLALVQGRPVEALQAFGEAQQVLASYPFVNTPPRSLARDRNVLAVHVAQARARLGEAGGALQAYESAAVLMREQLQSDPNDPYLLYDLAVCLANIGQTLKLAATYSESLASLSEARDMLQRGAERFPADLRWRHQLAAVEQDIARVQIERGALQEAEDATLRGLLAIQELVAHQPGEVAYRDTLGRSLAVLADIRRLQGSPEEAQGLWEECVALRRELVAQQPDNAQARRSLAVALSRLGDIARELAHLPAALAAYEEQLELSRQLQAGNPHDPNVLQNLAISLGSIANLRAAAGEPEAARAALLESLQLFRQVAARPEADVEDWRNVAVALGFLGADQLAAGELADALQSFLEAQTLQQTLLEEHPDSVGIRRSLGNTLAQLAGLHEAAGDHGQALELYRQTWELLAESTTAGQISGLQTQAFVAQQSAMIHLSRGAHHEALRWYERCVAAGAALAAVDPRFERQHAEMQAYLEQLRAQVAPE